MWPYRWPKRVRFHFVYKFILIYLRVYGGTVIVYIRIVHDHGS